MFKVSPVSLQTFIYTPNCVLKDRVQYSTVHIPNVFCDGHLHLINCVYYNSQGHRDFSITLNLEIRRLFSVKFPASKVSQVLFVNKKQ